MSVGDEMERLVRPIKDADNSEGAVFVFGSELELLAVVPRI